MARRSPCSPPTTIRSRASWTQAGIDVVLVGDSASNVIHGHETTVPITLDQMIDHAAAVVRGVQRALVVVDMPFGSYQGDSRLALQSAVRIMKESGAHCVKMEGGEFIVESIKRILSAGIPVMGHLGLTPQSIYKFGTYVVRATKDRRSRAAPARRLLLQESGCFGIVLEKIPSQLAERVAKQLTIPVIGIGAGRAWMGRCSSRTTCWASTRSSRRASCAVYAQLHDVMNAASSNTSRT